MDSKRGLTQHFLIFGALILFALIFVWRNLSIISGAFPGHESYSARMASDSTRYTQGAQAILEGRPLVGKQSSYLGYISVLAFIEQAGFSQNTILIVHLILNLVAAIAIYDLGRKLGGKMTGLLTAAIFLENPDIATWNIFILADSFYIFILIITVWSVSQAPEKKGLWYVVALVALFEAALVRPNGWITLPVAGIYWIICLDKSIVARALWISIALSIFLLASFGVPTFKKGIESEKPIRMLLNGKIIWADDDWRLDMPREPGLKRAGWSGAIAYVTKHPFAVAKLATYRIATSLSHIRPQYLLRQNVHYAVMLTLLYALAVAGLLKSLANPLSYLLVMMISGHLLIIAMTFADTDGRFLLYYLPLICVFSGRGGAILFQRKYSSMRI